jgi:plasmid segregation protein ParM
MKNQNGIMIIGVDHGYGNIKTANCCFPTGIMGYESEPLFTADMLTYDGRYYLIGEGHKEFLAEKTLDDDYYLLTLVAIARELALAELTEASVYLAVGLPLTWTASQKAEFAAYLSRNEEVCFIYKKVDYRVRIVGIKVYPQGYAAVAQLKGQMKGVCMVADIGNGTMNVLYMISGKPQTGRMYTEKFGTYQCTLAAREEFMRRTRRELNDAIIDEVLRSGTADIREDDLSIIRASATEYVQGIFRRLREHGYDADTMTLYFTGRGGCLVRNFGQFDPDRVRFVDDICAAAKGYEYMAALQIASGI